MSILGQALRRTSPPPRPGVTVEILGHAWPGEFAPVIGHAADGTLATIRVLGEGSFPEPKSLPHELMARAKLDSEWVRARGVVRSLAAWPNLDEQRLLVDLSTEVGRLKLVVAGWRQESTPTNWVDALVEVEGVLGGEFGPRRFLQGMLLYVRSADAVRLLDPAPEAPFAQPFRQAADLVRFNRMDPLARRVLVEGTLIMQIKGGRMYVQTASGPMVVHASGAPRMKLGDRLALLGFLAVGPLGIALEDATFKVIGQETLGAPKVLPTEVLIESQYNGERVALEATLRDLIRTPEGPALTLESDSQFFTAILGGSPPDASWYSLRPRSRIQVSGVNEILLDEYQRARTFRIWIHEPQDVKVLDAPSI